MSDIENRSNFEKLARQQKKTDIKMREKVQNSTDIYGGIMTRRNSSKLFISVLWYFHLFLSHIDLRKDIEAFKHSVWFISFTNQKKSMKVGGIAATGPGLYKKNDQNVFAWS